MWRSRVIPVEDVSRGVKGTPHAAAGKSGAPHGGRAPARSQGLVAGHHGYGRAVLASAARPAGYPWVGRPVAMDLEGRSMTKDPTGLSASSPEPVRESSPGCRRCCFGGRGVLLLLVAGAPWLTDGSRRAEARPSAPSSGRCVRSRGARRGGGTSRRRSLTIEQMARGAQGRQAPLCRLGGEGARASRPLLRTWM